MQLFFVQAACFLLHDTLVRATELWSLCRKVLTRHMEEVQAAMLAARRPNYYCDLTNLNVK